MSNAMSALGSAFVVAVSCAVGLGIAERVRPDRIDALKGGAVAGGVTLILEAAFSGRRRKSTSDDVHPVEQSTADKSEKLLPPQPTLDDYLQGYFLGEKLADGTVYAGFSPDTGQPMFAQAADAPSEFSFDKAQQYAASLDANGHHDWRVPSQAELRILFRNRAAIGGFVETGWLVETLYWSSSPANRQRGWAQQFGDGEQHKCSKYGHFNVRCVR